MKEINCNIIRDILPLYVDGVVSTDTREMVEDHLGCCEKCKKEVEEMKQELYIPVEKEAIFIKNFKKKWRNKKLIISGLSILLTSIILIVAFSFIFHNEAVQDLSERGEVYKEGDIFYYFGTNYQGIIQYGQYRKIPIINRFELALDTKKNILSAKFVFPAKQYKSRADGRIEFKVDLEQEDLLFIQVDEFQGYRNFEKLELLENEIIPFSKAIQKQMLGTMEGTKDM